MITLCHIILHYTTGDPADMLYIRKNADYFAKIVRVRTYDASDVLYCILLVPDLLCIIFNTNTPTNLNLIYTYHINPPDIFILLHYLR